MRRNLFEWREKIERHKVFLVSALMVGLTLFGLKSIGYIDLVPAHQTAAVINTETTIITYDFEADAVNSNPSSVTYANGTAKVAEHPTEGKGMYPLTVASGNTAIFNMDNFPSTSDYSVTWKETYTTAGRSGFILRAHDSSSASVGLKQGYLFQANPALNRLRIYMATPNSGYTQIATESLKAPGQDKPRWYRATVEGTTLTFAYSDNGTDFTAIITTSDSNYTSGTTQFARGYTYPIEGAYIDDVVFKSTGYVAPAPQPQTTITYTFEADEVNSNPSDITDANGAAKVAEHPTEGKGLYPLTARSGNTAIFDLDNFPSASDYSVTWKETYVTAGRSGFILRAHDNSSASSALKQGYLFQANPALNNVRVYIATPRSGYEQIASESLKAPGKNASRWYRATVEGTTLTFAYSDNGTDFTTIVTVEDSTYPAGATQFARGYTYPIEGAYIDDISYEGPGGSIKITNLSDYQVLQRTGSDKTDIYVEGVYGGTSGSIEARWGDGPFTELDTGTNAPGTFSGTLKDQPDGQKTLDVRFVDSTGIHDTIQYLGIGDVFVIAGQSNASGRGFDNNTYTHPYLKATMFGNDDQWKELSDPTDSNDGQVDKVSSDGHEAAGSPWPIVATKIMASEGIPVAFIPTAKGATTISQWQPGTDRFDSSTLYGSMNRRVKAAGGTVAGVLFHQGEADAAHQTTGTVYESALSSFVDAVSADLGVKTMIGQIGDLPYSQPTDVIRAAQAAVIRDDVNALRGPSTYDINLEDEGGDHIHFRSVGDMDTFATRWYEAINAEFYGGEDGHGPQVSNATYNPITNQFHVYFTDESTPVISPDSTVSASSFLVKNGSGEVDIAGLQIVGDSLEFKADEHVNLYTPFSVSYAIQSKGVERAIYDTNGLPAQPFIDVPITLGY